MPLVVVTGLSGAGKSTVYERLRAMGLEAWGSDEDGFLEWSDRATGRPAPAPADFRDSVANSDIYCSGVSRQRVEALKAEAGGRTVYLCGCAGHEAAFLDLIDHLICLVADDETLRHRLMTRTNHSYGKSSEELKGVLDANQIWEEAYRKVGATIVDATQPVEVVVADIIAAVEAE